MSSALDKKNSLLGSMIAELIESGISVLFSNRARIAVESGGTISGGFSEEEKELEVASGREDWFLIFAHEYCHFKQWQEGIFDDPVIVAAYSVFDSWLEGKRELSPFYLEKYIRSMQWLEWENENRTIALLDSKGIKYDKENYIRMANVYFYSYELCKRIRKWHTRAFYDFPELKALVPGESLISPAEFDSLPKGFEAIAIRCYDFNKEEEE